MNFEAHYVLSLCLFQLHQLKTMQNCIPVETARTLVNTLLVTRLDYCNSLLAGSSSCQLDRLQSVFNAAATLVCCASRYDHIMSLLRDELHWLHCREPVTFKLCMMVYKSLHSEVLGYLQELCVPFYMNTHYSTLQSASDFYN